MPPVPTGRYELIRIPAPTAVGVSVRYAPLTQRDKFDPAMWPAKPLVASAPYPGWWELDIGALELSDGIYEYEFLLDGNNAPIADPFADELTRFGGYRGIFRIAARQRAKAEFRWDDEFTGAPALPANNKIVIYEMPVKWMASDPAENNQMAELGTFEKIIFERLDYLQQLGINCIELLPVQDTSQTLNWGYGTRFYFAPDYDMGQPTDLRFFVKTCHQRGIRVILDVVMNFFSTTCPLAQLDSLAGPAWFSVTKGTDGRNDFGQVLFRFNTPSYGAYYAAREFLCLMAELWVEEYHVDGFRIDDFADIGNWEFVQEFRRRAMAVNTTSSPGKPFIVIAEDSHRDFASTLDTAYHGHRVVDALWNFGYRDEVRRLAQDQITTVYGQPSRSDRVRHAMSQAGVWNGLSTSFDSGFSDLACSICYLTSHDVKDAARLMNVILGSILQTQQLGAGDVADVCSLVDGDPSDGRLSGAVNFALYRIFGAFALLMTSVGIPMFLAGEEFADVHDSSFSDVDTKQQDPVHWARAAYPGSARLLGNVAKLIQLRVSAPALQRDEIDFFYFHPNFDDDSSPRVFGYARTAGAATGVTGQVIVLANMGSQKFDVFEVPLWLWGGLPLTEVGNDGASGPAFNPADGSLGLSMDAFQARVFTT